MTTVIDLYREKSESDQKTKKLLRQVKVLRDQVKEAQTTEGDTKSIKLASGLAFVELADHDAALFTVRHLNNMQLTGRGLVVDFCLEDARKLQARTQKQERQEKHQVKACCVL